MKISGFTFLRNASQLYYPITESIRSILPIVDEFVIALGAGSNDDQTEEQIRSIGSDKIRIIPSTWDLEKYPNGSVYAQQTDLAKSHCKGDWLFYLQGDEVIHEDDHDKIIEACSSNLGDAEVEGLLFDYLHFWGDYKSYFQDHCWYPKEIRIVRNRPEIHSYGDAQSFRHIKDFDQKNYFQKSDTRKLRVRSISARVFHYGWVRPPHLMLKKKQTFDQHYKGDAYVNEEYKKYDEIFDYGRLDRCLRFKGSHPSVMKDKISSHDWSNVLRYSGPIAINRPIFKHERLKYRIIMWLERNLLNNRLIGGFKNYELLK